MRPGYTRISSRPCYLVSQQLKGKGDAGAGATAAAAAARRPGPASLGAAIKVATRGALPNGWGEAEAEQEAGNIRWGCARGRVCECVHAGALARGSGGGGRRDRDRPSPLPSAGAGGEREQYGLITWQQAMARGVAAAEATLTQAGRAPTAHPLRGRPARMAPVPAAARYGPPHSTSSSSIRSPSM